MCHPQPPPQLLEDSYLLEKYKQAIADKRARANNFTRTLADVARTLRDMGVYCSVQVRLGQRCRRCKGERRGPVLKPHRPAAGMHKARFFHLLAPTSSHSPPASGSSGGRPGGGGHRGYWAGALGRGVLGPQTSGGGGPAAGLVILASRPVLQC